MLGSVFSRKSEFPIGPNLVTQRRIELSQAGHALLDLSGTNPTTVGLDLDSDWLTSLAHRRSLTYEPEAFGMPGARQALAARWARAGHAVSPDNILLTASTSEAYGYLFKLLCDPGDQILVPRPSYPLFEQLAQLEQIELVTYPLEYDGCWYIDIDELRARRSGRTKAVILVSPNNPTGSVTRPDEFSALDQLGVPVISDEVFSGFLFGSARSRFRSALALENSLVFVLDGLSKSFGLPQCKLAWTTVSGPGKWVEPALERLEVIADAFLGAATPIQAALPELLAREMERRAGILTRLERNLHELRRIVSGTTVTVLELDGGWSAVLRLPSTRSETDWVITLLEGEGLWVQPGWFFDFTREAYVVVSLLTPPDEFARGIERLVRRVDVE